VKKDVFLCPFCGAPYHEVISDAAEKVTCRHCGSNVTLNSFRERQTSKHSAKTRLKRKAFLCPFCGAPYSDLIPAGTVQVKCSYCKSTIFVPPRLGGSIQRCINHPEKLVAGRCNGCGKNFCGDCLIFQKTAVSQSDSRFPEYAYFCIKCAERKGLKSWRAANEGSAVLGGVLLFFGFIGLLFGLINEDTNIPDAIGILIIFFGVIILASSLGTKYDLPKVSMIEEKLSELRNRSERIKDGMTDEEVEELYWKIHREHPLHGVDPRTGRRIWIKHPDDILKSYMKSNMSRRDAIFKLTDEFRVEIKPGIYIQPTMEDALSAIQDEIKNAEKAKLMKNKMLDIQLTEESKFIYKQLLHSYGMLRSNPRQLLEMKIKSLRKKGISREEVIKQLAVKEKIIEE